MKVYLATDHAGFQLKEEVKKHLHEKGYEVEDLGAHEFVKTDDFTDFISKAGEAVSKDPLSFGIIFGGSGQGEAILANKYKNVRAALFYGPILPQGSIDVLGKQSTDEFEMLRLTREHNNSNILSLAARFLTKEQAIKAVDTWLNTPFSGEERHARRIDKISDIEEENGLSS